MRIDDLTIYFDCRAYIFSRRKPKLRRVNCTFYKRGIHLLSDKVSGILIDRDEGSRSGRILIGSAMGWPATINK
jgi:hypothetical protein